MSKPNWTNVGIRSYKKRTAKAEAYVFGAYRPMCLWAWSVYWSGGHASGVVNSFRDAKLKADAEIWARE